MNEQIKLNSELNKDNTMCEEGYFKGLKVLICEENKNQIGWIIIIYLKYLMVLHMFKRSILLL